MPLTVTASFSINIGPIMPLNRNPHQTVNRFGCVGFSMYECRISVLQMRQFCLFDWFFFLPKSAFSVSRSQTHLAKNALDRQLASTPEPIELCMASYQGVYAKFVSMMSPKCSIVENDGELMLMALHTPFLPQQRYSRVYALFLVISRFGLSMRMPVSFNFFTR